MSKKKTVSNVLLTLTLVVLPQFALAQTNTFPSSGNAGVNTTSPPNPFTVARSGSAPYTGRPANELLQLVDKTDNTPQVLFGSAYNGMILRYTGTEGTALNQRLGIFTGAGGESFVINNDGLVGIGTISPSRTLSISRSVNPSIAIDGPAIDFSTNQQNAFGAYADDAAELSLSNNSTGGVWLKSFNKAAPNGIGGYFTSDSENDLTTYSSFEFVAKKHNGAGGLTSHGASARIFSVLNNSTNLLNVLGNGNVGIGTTSPATSFHVKSTTATVSPRFESTFGSATLDLLDKDDTGYSYINFGTTGGRGWQIGKSANSGVGPDGGFYFYELTTGSAGARLAISKGGNVGIGTTSPAEKLEINGNLKLSGTGNLTATGTIEAGNIKAKYQDLAEWVPSSEQLAAGTVVVLDTTKSNQVVSATVAYDTRVAGVISAQPGITLGESGEGKVLVATTGRVRVKVDASRGPIQIGDLLVTSDVLGVAMKSEAVNLGGVQIHRPGTIIGKALEPLAKGKGEILVLLSLQ